MARDGDIRRVPEARTLDRADAERIARNLRAMADPTRVQLLSVIGDSAHGRVPVGELATALGLTQPTVSHHLRIMVNEGLLEREKHGREAWYSVLPERLAEVFESVGGVWVGEPSPALLDRIAADLALRFRGVFSLETIAAVLRESYALLADRSPNLHNRTSLAARFAGDRLRALAEVEGLRAAGVPEVLFVCVQNAGRSQLASAILRALVGDRVRVTTAGSKPAATVNPMVIAALDEIGVPLAGEYPKPLTDEVVRAADFVVTMGCGDACPVYPGRRYLDWELADPVGLSMDAVRAIRDEIDSRVRALLKELKLDLA